MSGVSSKGVGWFTKLRHYRSTLDNSRRQDDPRLAEVATFWSTGEPDLSAARPVLLGFPCDEGVVRNQGRPGAAQAPLEIRRSLYRLTATDAQSNVSLADIRLLDMGDVPVANDLEDALSALGLAVSALLTKRAVPVVLGGGHETAFGHYLGYAHARQQAAIINVDAHLDVRPLYENRGHSGSPFRQAMEHADWPLKADRYVCLGAQPHSVSQAHAAYVKDQGGTIWWCNEIQGRLVQVFQNEARRLAAAGNSVYLSIDADAVDCGEVPGVSAPNVTGLSGAEVIALARAAGGSSCVTSMDVVEISPPHDRDGQSARWAALVVWSFLAGLALRHPKMA